MKRFWMFTKALTLVHVRNRTILFWNLVFPVFMLGIYALIFGGGSFGGGDVRYVDWVLPGVLVFNALAFGVVTSSSMMLSMRENGVLRRLQATPMPASQLVGSYVLVNVVIVMIQSLIILLTAALVFGVDVSLQGAMLALPMVLVGVLTFVGIGQIVGGLAPTAAAATIIGQLLYFSMMFVTDLIMPIEALPDWLQSAARLLPSYAVVQLIRPPLLEGSLHPQTGLYIGIALAYALAAALIASRLFRWEPRR